MPTLCDECCSIENGKIVTRTENRRRFEIVNTKGKQVKVCIVDGCLVQGDGKRCDYLFLVPGRAILVELKERSQSGIAPDYRKRGGTWIGVVSRGCGGIYCDIEGATCRHKLSEDSESTHEEV